MATPAPAGENLANSGIDLHIFKERAEQELIAILDSVNGSKGVAIDPSLSGPLSLIAQGQLFKDHGVEKLLYLEPTRLPCKMSRLVYFVRPTVENMRAIANHIHDHLASRQKKQYHIYFVPRKTMICERVLEEEGVYGNVSVGEFMLDLLPFDDDVVSLELDHGYRECFMEGNKTSLFYVARSLMKIQSIYGVIPTIKGKGTCAKLVADMMLRMRREMDSEESTTVPEIDQVILIDRQVDMITPMCTQLTYEGLIDEFFGITNGIVSLPGSIVDKEPPQKDHPFPLNSNDSLFSDIRDVHFASLGPRLNQRAKEIDAYYKKRHDQKSLGEIRDYVKNLGSFQKEHKSLQIHTRIAEKILGHTKDPDFPRILDAEQGMVGGDSNGLEFVEECINKHLPLARVLRLLVVHSLTHSGMKAKAFDFFRNEILQTYGHEFLFSLLNLERLGLLTRQEGHLSRAAAFLSGPYGTVRKNLKLVVDNAVDMQTNVATDMAYVYSSFAPITGRLVQAAVRPGGWRSIEDALKAIPGPTVEAEQDIPAGVRQLSEDTGAAQGPRSKVTLVFFIGGCTYTEISAIRFLHKQQGNQDFVIATTKLINGTSLLKTLVEPVGNATPENIAA